MVAGAKGAPLGATPEPLICHSRRLHRKPRAMTHVGGGVIGAVAVTYYECSACGRVRTVERPLFVEEPCSGARSVMAEQREAAAARPPLLQATQRRRTESHRAVSVSRRPCPTCGGSGAVRGEHPGEVRLALVLVAMPWLAAGER